MNHHDAKAGYGGFLGGGAPLDSHEDRGRNAASFITLSAVQQDNRRAMRAMGTSFFRRPVWIPSDQSSFIFHGAIAS